MKLKTQIWLTLALGVVTVLAGVVNFLALTDIFHGETDLTLEWTLVRYCQLVFLAFVGVSFATATRMLRAVPGLKNGV